MFSQFKCCGIDSATDWQKSDANRFAHGLPPSCCKVDTGNPCINTQFEAYQTGCFSELEMKVQKNAKVLIGVGIGIAFVEVNGKITILFLLLKISIGSIPA